MEELHQALIDEAEARYKVYQLLSKSIGSVTAHPAAVAAVTEKKPKKKRAKKADPNWKCLGNLNTKEPCAEANPVFSESAVRVLLDGNEKPKNVHLCTACHTKFQKSKKGTKKPAAPKKQTEEEEVEVEEEEQPQPPVKKNKVNIPIDDDEEMD